MSGMRKRRGHRVRPDPGAGKKPRPDDGKAFLCRKNHLVAGLSQVGVFPVLAAPERAPAEPTPAAAAPRRRSLARLSLPPMFDAAVEPRRAISLVAALQVRGTAWTPTLVYGSDAVRRLNVATADACRVQRLPEADERVYAEFSRRVQAGILPALTVLYDLVWGFFVETALPFADRALVAEYVGEVDTEANRAADRGSCIFKLLATGSPATSLVICPERRGGIAHLLQGIAPGSRPNVASTRFRVGDEVHVVLYTTVEVPRGVPLRYDYNGAEDEYPVDGFQ